MPASFPTPSPRAEVRLHATPGGRCFESNFFMELALVLLLAL